MRVEFVVELQEGCWLMDGDGDPARTCDVAHALGYKTMKKADAALKAARRYHPFLHANIYRDKKAVSC